MQKLPQISHYTLEHKNSHRFHRSTQMLIALFSHRIHRTHRTFCYKNLCKSVKSVGVFLSRKFCVFREFCGSFSQQKVLYIPRILWEHTQGVQLSQLHQPSRRYAFSVGALLALLVHLRQVHPLKAP